MFHKHPAAKCTRLHFAFVLFLTSVASSAFAENGGLWHFESDLHSDFKQESVTIQIDGQNVATLKTFQKKDKTTAYAPYRPKPGPHRYDLSGTSQAAAPAAKPLAVTGKGWLYTQAELKHDFDALAPASPYQRLASIYKQWAPRIQQTGGKPLTAPPLHPAARAKSIADAEARLGVKLPANYIRLVSQPYLAHRLDEKREPVADGVFPPEDIVSVLTWLGKPYAETKEGKANFARTARHFILARHENDFLISRDDYPSANSRQKELRLQVVSIYEETSTENSDPYEWYPFDSVEAGKKISPDEFMNETVFGILQRGLAHSGVTLLGNGTDQIRLWRLEDSERTLKMDLRYIGYDGVD